MRLLPLHRTAVATMLAAVLVAGCGGSSGNGTSGSGGLTRVAVEPETAFVERMEQLIDGEPEVDKMLALWSEGCRAKSGLADLSDAEREEAEEALRADTEGASLVDVTSRPRPGGGADVEVLVENADGELEGALQWLSVVEEDGEWRFDDCEARARFRRIGESIGSSPRTPPITPADEERIARTIEARYLGSGPAEAVWDAQSSRCRDVEWAGSFDDFEAQHAAIGERMSTDPVAFVVEAVSLVSTVDDMAQGHVVATRDGYTIDTAASSSGFDYLYEDGAWRNDDCAEPATEEDDTGDADDTDADADERFEEIGEAISE